MTEDISHILQNWDFDPESYMRKIMGDDGKEKVLMRISDGPFEGILQMELEGSPGGKRPYGYDFALDYYIEELKKYKDKYHEEEDFTLDEKACEELFEESRSLYTRSIILRQMNDYRRIVRDTEKNMELFRFVNKYATDEKDRNNLEKWWPYILRMNGIARSRISLDKKEYDLALFIIQETKKKIEELEEVKAEEFYIGIKISRVCLQNLENLLIKIRPKSKLTILNWKLERAVAEENYEKAAIIRDFITEHIENL